MPVSPADACCRPGLTSPCLMPLSRHNLPALSTVTDDSKARLTSPHPSPLPSSLTSHPPTLPPSHHSQAPLALAPHDQRPRQIIPNLMSVPRGIVDYWQLQSTSESAHERVICWWIACTPARRMPLQHTSRASTAAKLRSKMPGNVPVVVEPNEDEINAVLPRRPKHKYLVEKYGRGYYRQPRPSPST